MDDGYADHHREYDRAELAEQRLALAIDALKHIRNTYSQTGPAVKYALNKIDALTQTA
jgi:hypothetical protein